MLAVQRSVVFVPQQKATEERIGIIAFPSMQWQRVEFFNVAASDHGFVRLERSDEACHDVADVTLPLLLPWRSNPALPT
jgi:hypothetical protein